MTYNPLIPNANDKISQSQVDIKTNFTQLASIFNLDHFKYDGSTPGRHRLITFPSIPAVPVPAGAGSAIYTIADPRDTGTKTQLIFKNATQTIQLTSIFSNTVAANTSNGYTMLPGDIILMWGFFVPLSTTETILFNTLFNYVGAPQGFINFCFNVVCTVADTSSNVVNLSIKASSTDKNKFVVKMDVLPTDGIYWWAVGN